MDHYTRHHVIYRQIIFTAMPVRLAFSEFVKKRLQFGKACNDDTDRKHP